ncbi:hypothetical protein ARMGADRAFT_790489 [Armillaria gallica]|uniref:Uncharacterized protein n=1 Tax=Armillaria gallica TaxID=47427 RepID=A0A2H3DMX9_ARMGA|nr:hypothetical protein ARMGADRAFT_790489 [Armillaria gallica]
MDTSRALTAAMTEQLETEIFSVPGCRTKLVTNPILISLILNTLIVISSMALPDHGAHTLWIGTSAATLTYTHHFAVLFLDRKYQRTSKKFPVMSTLWCIIALFLIGALWLVAIAFEFCLGLVAAGGAGVRICCGTAVNAHRSRDHLLPGIYMYSGEKAYQAGV